MEEAPAVFSRFGEPSGLASAPASAPACRYGGCAGLIEGPVVTGVAARRGIALRSKTHFLGIAKCFFSFKNIKLF